MSELAREITGMTEIEIREYDFPRITSRNQVSTFRQYLGSEDLEPIMRKILRRAPRWIRPSFLTKLKWRYKRWQRKVD